jgi:hypothetical protein
MKKGLSSLECSQIVRHYWNLVSQTAEFRYRICWHGARALFRGRGYDTLSVIQLSCDQGDDVHGDFILPDGMAVSCDLREDPETRQATSFQAWEPIECSISDGDDFALALQILQEPRLKVAFDRAVQAFFDFHWAERDHPLPPSSSLGR